MGMNIKNDETYRLTRELAATTGESLTEAVTESVRERLVRVRQRQHDSLSERLLRIGQECAPRLTEPYRSSDYADLLYDERGLPT